MIDNKSNLDKLQENLAKDLVELEENKSVDETVVDEVTKGYSKVYDIITELKSL